MKSNFSKTVLILILTVTLPVTQAYAIVPDLHPVMSDVTEASGTFSDINIVGPISQEIQQLTVPQDFALATTILSASPNATGDIAEIQIEEEDELLFSPLAEEQRFWTKGKIIIASAIVLSTTLLLSLVFLLSFSGSGSGSGSGDNAGGAPSGNPPPQNNNSNFTDDSHIPTCEETGTCENPPLLTATCEETGTCENPPLLTATCEETGTCEIEELIKTDGEIPHNPEPSTFLLMGLGLLVPGFRKRLGL